MFQQLYNALRSKDLVEQTTTPEAPPKPKAPPEKEPTKPAPKNPIIPEPGIHPRPKATTTNRDVELFKKARSSLHEMAFDPGKTSKFIHRSKKKWIETGDEQLDKLLPNLSDKGQTYLEMITSSSYQELVKRLESYMKKDASKIRLPQLVSIVYQSLIDVQEIESSHKEKLEKLALDSVLELEEFEMVKDAYENGVVKFDVQLGEAELRLEDFDTDVQGNDLSPAEELNMELADELEDENENSLIRKFANLLIQGSSTLKLYLFNLLKPELNAIDSRLLDYYGILAVFAQLGYWLSPTGVEQEAAKIVAAGSSEVIPEGDMYTIKVRAVTFPYLVCDLTKGIYEWISLKPELKDVMSKEEIEGETQDIIVGTELSKIISSYIPTGKQKLLPLIRKKLLSLSSSKIKEILAKSEKGKSIMSSIIRQSEEEWGKYKSGGEEVQEATTGDAIAFQPSHFGTPVKGNFNYLRTKRTKKKVKPINVQYPK